MPAKPKLFIGTSGWAYSGWEGIFYPEDLSSKDRLKFFSQHFKTTEVNYSFYHLPRVSTYQKWYSQTPLDFLFAIKVSRFITHVKRLKKGVGKAWKKFLGNALNLKEKLGPFLFQLPPSFQATNENLTRFEQFFKLITQSTRPGFIVRCAFEFRHKSWCEEKIYQLLKKHNVAWVITDSPRYPRRDALTADFVYVRMHGPGSLYSSKYAQKELSSLAEKIKKWLKKDKDVFIYFNNDFQGFAIENAKQLVDILSKK